MMHHRVTTRPNDPARKPARRGFTLLELLVSISVILILVGIVSVVGFGALGGQKAAQTRGLLSSLDRALEEYYLAVGDFPKYRTSDYTFRPGTAWDVDSGGVADAAAGSLALPAFAADSQNVFHARKPSAGVFLAQARGVAESDAIISSLPVSLLLTTPRRTGVAATTDLNAITVLDGWSKPETQWGQAKSAGNPAYPALRQSYILYVHPSNTVAQDLYGGCRNGRPYFMSAGPDTSVGLRGELDPIYLGVPDEADRVHGFLKDNISSYPVSGADTSAAAYTGVRQ